MKNQAPHVNSDSGGQVHAQLSSKPGNQDPSVLPFTNMKFLQICALHVAFILLCGSTLRLNVRADSFVSFESSIHFMALSLLGSSDWSVCEGTSFGSFLTIIVLLVLNNTLGVLVMMAWTIKLRNFSTAEFENSIRRLISPIIIRGVLLFKRISKRLRLLQNIKQYFPGLYYKVLLPQEQFRHAVAKAQAKRQDTSPDAPSKLRDGQLSESLKSYPEIGQDDLPAMRSIKLAVEDFAYRIRDVGTVVKDQSRDMSHRLEELNKVILHMRKQLR